MSEPRTCWRCGEKPATICTTCQGDLAAYYDQQIENLTTPLAQAAPELLAALRAVEWVEMNPDSRPCYAKCPVCRAHTDLYVGGDRYIGTHRPGCQLAAALARAEAPGSGEV